MHQSRTIVAAAGHRSSGMSTWDGPRAGRFARTRLINTTTGKPHNALVYLIRVRTMPTETPSTQSPLDDRPWRPSATRSGHRNRLDRPQPKRKPPPSARNRNSCRPPTGTVPKVSSTNRRSVPASAGSHPAITSCSGSFRAADAAPVAPPGIRTCATSVAFSVWLDRSATARAVTMLGASTWD